MRIWLKNCLTWLTLMPTYCWSSSRMEIMSSVENLDFMVAETLCRSESKIKRMMMILITIKFE